MKRIYEYLTKKFTIWMNKILFTKEFTFDFTFKKKCIAIENNL